MLDQLQQLVQQHTPQALATVPEVPADRQQTIAQEASHSIFSGMQQLLQQGGPGALKGLFEGAQTGDANNPQVQQLTGQFTSNLTQKTGLSAGIARSIGAALIPLVLSKVFHKTKDPNDPSFTIGGILGSLLGSGTNAGSATGSPTGGTLGSVLGGVLGSSGTKGGLGSLLDRDGDGDTDLADLKSLFH